MSCALAPNLVEEQQLDLKVMRSDEVDGVYELMLAVTDKLEAQAVNHPECRHKLLRFVQTELAKDEDSWSQGRSGPGRRLYVSWPPVSYPKNRVSFLKGPMRHYYGWLRTE